MHLLQRLLITLSKNKKSLPQSLYLHGVVMQGMYAVSGGGFADIFRASYRGQHVALKRLRRFYDRAPSESEENVSHALPKSPHYTGEN